MNNKPKIIKIAFPIRSYASIVMHIRINLLKIPMNYSLFFGQWTILGKRKENLNSLISSWQKPLNTLYHLIIVFSLILYNTEVLKTCNQTIKILR